MNAKVSYLIAVALVIVLSNAVVFSFAQTKSKSTAQAEQLHIVQVTNCYVLLNGTHTINGVEFPGDPTATMEKTWVKFSDGSIRVVDNLICPCCGERMLVSYYDEFAPYKLVWHCNNCSEEIVTCLNSTST